MSKYAELTDIKDSLCGVIVEELAAADNAIDAMLRQKGIDPDAVELPNGSLTDLAVVYACWRACVRKSTGAVDSTFPEKARLYKQLWEDGKKSVDKKTLGLATSGYAPITIGRG